MKKIIAVLLFVVSSLAFALPSPQQIEQALMHKDYATARSMTEEVLREKPEAAKAHLYNAYLLAHVDKNKVAAAEELKNVQRFDKKGDTKNSALFGRVVAELETMKSSPVPRPQNMILPRPQASTQAASVPVAPSKEGSHMFIWVLLGIGGVLLVLVYIQHRNKRNELEALREDRSTLPPSGASSQPYVHNTDYSRPASSSYPSRRFAEREQPSQVFVQQVPAAPQQGMSGLGMAGSVAGGVVAGNLLSDMLRNSHGSHGSGHTAPAVAAPAPVYEAPAQVDYESRSSSFSSGSSGWDSGSSSSSSSSWDSGSSSSSDSYSSSDSGSSWD